jgi:cyclohexa-1,5-dienecarbonyl-CoA hydratase
VTAVSPSPSAGAVRLHVSDGIARISLDRPPLNVLDVATVRELNATLAEANGDGIRVVLMSSALPSVFSAGVDIRDHAPDRLKAMFSEVRENARLLLALSAVTIAAVKGSTLGGGAEIALLCDYVIAAEDATFRLPEIALAAFPPIAAALLPERCASAVAMRLLLGEPLDARSAMDAGLVTEVTAKTTLDDVAEARARKIAGHSAVALRALVASTRGQRAAASLQRIDAAIATYKATIGGSRDAQEGIDAFLEKRTPAWRHG